VEIGVSDLTRSRAFYAELLRLRPLASDPGEQWLDGGGGRVRLVEVGETGTPSGWLADNAQCGIRHLGLKVADTDAHADRLRAAGVQFMVEPFTAVGGGRIAFFGDPDGTQLELVAGTPDYHRTWSEELAAQERGELPGPEEPPRFDHVAITVSDLDPAIAFYRELGIEVIGQLFHDGFTLTFLEGLELFSFDHPTTENPWAPDPRRLGFRGVGLTSETLAPGPLLDPDGTPLEVAP
jgi:catechol 2,3-dioxygenase-like lactoylglutathione lyase family enzyme